MFNSNRFKNTKRSVKFRLTPSGLQINPIMIDFSEVLDKFEGNLR